MKLGDVKACEIDDCDNDATVICYSRSRKRVVATCDGHEAQVMDEDNPEYWHTCENCGCGLPIN